MPVRYLGDGPTRHRSLGDAPRGPRTRALGGHPAPSPTAPHTSGGQPLPASPHPPGASAPNQPPSRRSVVGQPPRRGAQDGLPGNAGGPPPHSGSHQLAAAPPAVTPRPPAAASAPGEAGTASVERVGGPLRPDRRPPAEGAPKARKGRHGRPAALEAAGVRRTDPRGRPARVVRGRAGEASARRLRQAHRRRERWGVTAWPTVPAACHTVVVDGGHGKVAGDARSSARADEVAAPSWAWRVLDSVGLDPTRSGWWQAACGGRRTSRAERWLAKQGLPGLKEGDWARRELWEAAGCRWWTWERYKAWREAAKARRASKARG